jgi:hypothetical protein
MDQPAPAANTESATAEGAGAPRRSLLRVWMTVAAITALLNLVVFGVAMSEPRFDAPLLVALLSVGALSLLQIVFALTAFVAALRRQRETRQRRHVFAALGAFVLAGMGALQGFFGLFFVLLSGAGWGRPLRIRGQLRHPELTGGSDWSRGEMPEVNKLDSATRRALEALWLHDAQKEHASVPAFTRVSWLLAAVGAPPQLLEGAHRAALEEADHACRCFALAAGYGGRAHTVQPMPDLLLAGFELNGPALEVLAVESLKDGCLLEDFNADIAHACAIVCREPATKGVLERIAREERSHAEFSWQVLEWALSQGGAPVARAVKRALTALDGTARPTATSRATARLVKDANAAQLLAHGRIEDAQWAALWPQRRTATMRRAMSLCARALDGTAAWASPAP